MLNKRGNIMLALLFFVMQLGVIVAFISPINQFLDLAQQSDSLNCKGFIYNGNINSVYSFNQTLDNNQSGNPLACLALKLYIPYILLIFLIGGISGVLAGKTEQMLGIPSSGGNYEK